MPPKKAAIAHLVKALNELVQPRKARAKATANGAAKPRVTAKSKAKPKAKAKAKPSSRVWGGEREYDSYKHMEDYTPKRKSGRRRLGPSIDNLRGFRSHPPSFVPAFNNDFLTPEDLIMNP